MLPKSVGKARDQLVNDDGKFIIGVAGSEKIPTGVSASGYHARLVAFGRMLGQIPEQLVIWKQRASCR